MDNRLKKEILDEIQKHTPVFKKRSHIQYSIRCPICGDSQSNPHETHCYIKCDFNNPSEPILYNCFKGNCGARGVVDSNFLKKLNIKSDIVNKIDNQKFNKIRSIAKTNIDLITGTPVMNSPQVKYIEDRLGSGFTFEDYDKFKIVWDMNVLLPYVSSSRVRNTMPSNNDSVTFLSDDKSTILIRSFDDNGDRWRKLSIIPSDNKSFYTIKTTLDLFTTEDIVVNIAEGVMDVLSIYKNFNGGNNSVYIAVLGSDYISGVEYAILKGLIGNNINIKVYIDDNINEKSLKYKLKKYKWLFKSISIYRNIKFKDVGVDIDKIKLVEQKV